MPEPVLVLGQTVISLPSSLLKWELVQIVVSAVLLFTALAAIALFFFRRKTGDLTLIFFGLFSLLFSVRLLTGLQVIRSLSGYSQTFWLYVNWSITCTIVVPFGLFLFQVVSESLRKWLRWVLIFQALFALVGLFGAAFGASLAKLHAANSIIVLVTTVTAALLFLLTGRRDGPRKPLTREISVFLAGFLVWGLFVVHANLLGLKIIPGRNVEFLGLLVFVACLGYVSAYRTFANEERLLAIHKELQIAQQIQSSTLPRSVPSLAGLDIAARYVPMSAVAGDFYDFLLVDERRVGVLIADVTGHGIPAALIASMLKVAFAGQSAHAEDPARLLTGLNRALCGKFEDHFVTAAYIFVDMDACMLRYAGAGHPPLFLASRSSGVRQIEENGLMLGLFPEAKYSATEIPLSPGDRCLLYTDGILEAMDSSQQEFGKARLQQSLEAHSDLSAAQFTSALLGEISRWSGHATGRRQEDDITLVALDFSGQP
jgi:sigma-B regulation protein RsbU (phosphoserine phosphatase)